MHILPPLLIALVLAGLLWPRHWGVGLGLAAALLAVSTLSWSAVLFLSPAAFAKLPLDGSTLSRGAWWLGVSGAGLLLVQIARAIATLSRRKS